MCNAHKDDVDKGGYPYVFHPIYLAMQMNGESGIVVALLHDVIEDHGDKYSFEYLEKQGFRPFEIETLKVLTHEHGINDEEYMDYIKKIGENELATKVKIADLKHNLDKKRLKGEKILNKERYENALKYLENIVDNYTVENKNDLAFEEAGFGKPVHGNKTGSVIMFFNQSADE